MDQDEDSIIYQVVANDEEQYSIWPAGRDIPAGWKGTGPSGPKSICLAYIEEVWTDMRPLSLRRAMDSQAAEPSDTTSGASQDSKLVAS